MITFLNCEIEGKLELVSVFDHVYIKYEHMRSYFTCFVHLQNKKKKLLKCLNELDGNRSQKRISNQNQHFHSDKIIN